MTAVEWFYNELKKHKLLTLPLTKGANSLFEKAIDVEKEQITDAYMMGSYDMATKEFNPEKYYNETFKKQ